MDEIDWIKKYVKAFRVIAFSFIGFAIVMLILILIGNTVRNEWQYLENNLLVVFIIGVPMPVFMLLCYIIIYIIEKLMNSGSKVISFDKNYIREIPISYSPAIVSLIYDLKIDIYKDYTATILELCNKKYIKLQKKFDKYNLEIGEKTDYSKLDRCEKYVLDTILNKNKFDEILFKQEIIKEAKDKKLITEKTININKIKRLLILLLSVILLIITYNNINKIIWIVLCTIIATIFMVYIFIEGYKTSYNFYILDTGIEYERTSKGKKLAKVSAGLKNFIKEYTLIKDKEIDYIKILEDYIPYAIALNEADTIEEFVKHNEEYRNLIYNREINNSY